MRAVPFFSVCFGCDSINMFVYMHVSRQTIHEKKRTQAPHSQIHAEYDDTMVAKAQTHRISCKQTNVFCLVMYFIYLYSFFFSRCRSLLFSSISTRAHTHRVYSRVPFFIVIMTQPRIIFFSLFDINHLFMCYIITSFY